MMLLLWDGLLLVVKGVADMPRSGEAPSWSQKNNSAPQPRREFWRLSVDLFVERNSGAFLQGTEDNGRTLECFFWRVESRVLFCEHPRFACNLQLNDPLTPLTRIISKQ
jgi:hypothetical protein